MVEVFDSKPFVRGWPEKSPVPYLLKRCDPIRAAEPVEHDVMETDEGFEHRIVWADNTGLRCLSPNVTFKPASLVIMYRKARPEAEEVEFYASGAICH